MPSTLEMMATRTISLLTTNDKTKHLVGVNRKDIEEDMKSLNIGRKILAKRSNAM